MAPSTLHHPLHHFSPLSQSATRKSHSYQPKSGGKFRCLSKSWRALLSTTHFIIFHLSHKMQQENLILINPSRSLHALTLHIKDCTHLRNLDLSNIWAYEVDSCNGLVLLLNDDNEMFVVNPITLQHVKIPDSPLALKKDGSYMMHGFGYDCSSDDYKIVILSYDEPNNEHEPDCGDTFMDVYSLKTGVWRRVNNSLCGHAVRKPFSRAFLNGAIHWLARIIEIGNPSMIAANEVFYEIHAPKDADEEIFNLHRLVVLGGRFCLLKNRSNSRTSLWIMKEYGEWDLIKPLCFIGDKEVLALNARNSLVVFNPKDRTLKDKVFGGVPSRFRDGGTSGESLVSPFFNG